MDKLENILRAEEDARHTLAAARESASSVLREAETRTRAIVDAARADSAEQARVFRAAALEAAGREAEEVRSLESAELESSLARARGRFDDVVARVAGELVG